MNSIKTYFDKIYLTIKKYNPYHIKKISKIESNKDTKKFNQNDKIIDRFDKIN